MILIYISRIIIKNLDFLLLIILKISLEIKKILILYIYIL
jgi:hypothetical protein